MYFSFSAGDNSLDNLISLGFYFIPILHSSTSDLKGSIFGFLATSFESKKSSNGANPLGKKLFLRFKICYRYFWVLRLQATNIHNSRDS